MDNTKSMIRFTTPIISLVLTILGTKYLEYKSIPVVCIYSFSWFSIKT